MIIIAKDGNRYLVKTNSNDDKCYLVDTNANFIFGYDIPERFLRFSYWEEFDQEQLTKDLENKLKSILKNNI